jgi:type VI protein secretion system component VasF
MTVSRRLRFTCEQPTDRPLRNQLRDKIERYEGEHGHYEDWKKSEIHKAAKKAREERAKRIRMIPWFFFWAHILMILEYLIYRNIWG